VGTPDEIVRIIEAEGFTVLGWLSAGDDFPLPDLAPGHPARTLALIGNAGPAMWQRFAEARAESDNPLDDWTRTILTDLAARFQARAVFPFEMPYLPFQRWAQAVGIAFTSPLGLTIHPRFGLWHAYRGALLFDTVMATPSRNAAATRRSPCDDCMARPCLSACPAGAFSSSGYDLNACITHLTGPAATICLDGCRARHACPVGREYAYDGDQARFHMLHFIRNHARI